MAILAGLTAGWRDSAACRSADPELFFATDTGRFLHPREAIRVCRDCPVIADCLEWAIRSGDKFAILGGMTPRQRTDYRRRYKS